MFTIRLKTLNVAIVFPTESNRAKNVRGVWIIDRWWLYFLWEKDEWWWEASGRRSCSTSNKNVMWYSCCSSLFALTYHPPLNTFSMISFSGRSFPKEQWDIPAKLSLLRSWILRFFNGKEIDWSLSIPS